MSNLLLLTGAAALALLIGLARTRLAPFSAVIALVVLVQGVGVSEAAPNLDGSPSDPNRDFIAQGAGNLAAGLFRGQPVGGSVGQTALNVAAGAQGRCASIFSGMWMLAIVVVFSGIVGGVVIPTLAAVLIYATIGSLRRGAMGTILRTGRASQIAFTVTLVATLFLPVAAAVDGRAEASGARGFVLKSCLAATPLERFWPAP